MLTLNIKKYTIHKADNERSFGIMFFNRLKLSQNGGGVPTPFVATSLLATILFPNSFALAEEVEEGENSNINIANYLESEDYIFTAERIPTNRWDTPTNIHIITAQEIEENHYHSVLEAVQHVNGIVIGVGTQMNGTNRVLMLVDGKRWLDPQNSTNDAKSMAYIPTMDMIERIEIIKGGNSALYGSDAFSGVVNIITKKGTRNETIIDLTGGSYKTYSYELSNQGVVGNFSWFLSGSLMKRNDSWDYKGTENTAFSIYNSLKEDGFSVRLDNRFTDRDSLTVGATHYSSHNHFDYFQTGQSQRDNGVYISYNFKEGTSTPSWLRYYRNESVFDDYGTSNPRSKMQGVDYQNGWEIGQHKFIGGVEWRQSKASYPLHGYDDIKIDTTSGYFQDTMSFGDRWKLVAGTRLDHSNEFGNYWSPKISTNYRADDKTKFYVSWGKSYNLPLISEMYSQIPADTENLDEVANLYVYQGYTRLNSTWLEPEKGDTWTMGFNHGFDDNTEIGVNFFASKLKNSLSWTTINDNGIYENFAVNSVPLKSRGVEIDFRQKINDHFVYNVGYSHTHAHFEGNQNITDPQAQPNGYRLALTYRNRGLTSNLQGIMASAIDTNYYPTKKYAVLNFNVNYDFNEHAMIYFKLYNLTNQSYASIPAAVSAYGNRFDYYEEGRSFIGGVRFRF